MIKMVIAGMKIIVYPEDFSRANTVRTLREEEHMLCTEALGIGTLLQASH